MEYLDIVNENDDVIGRAEYDEVYRNKLMHRIVHILIFNDRGEMMVQKRSMAKSYCPGRWSTSVGGHVQTGETYEQAALREMQEELGVQMPMEWLGKNLYQKPPSNLSKFLGTFTARHNGPFVPDPAEVESVAYFPVATVLKMKDEDMMHPELKFLLEEYGYLWVSLSDPLPSLPHRQAGSPSQGEVSRPV